MRSKYANCAQSSLIFYHEEARMKPNTSDLSVGWIIKSFTECLEKEASSNKLKIPQIQEISNMLIFLLHWVQMALKY